MRAIAYALVALARRDGVKGWRRARLRARVQFVVTPHPPWLDRLVAKVLRRWPVPAQVEVAELFAFLRASRVVRRALLRAPVRVFRWRMPAPEMGPVRWQVPPLTTTLELAQWLDLDHGPMGTADNRLSWYADTAGLLDRVTDEAMRHYHVTWVRKSRGGVRLLEAPKPRLRDMQRKVLREILERVPLAEPVHGFVRGRGARTHAARHVGRVTVLRLDLMDFFLTISLARVRAIFSALGYPPDVAATLARLCTHRTTRACPAALLGDWPTRDELAARRLAEQRARTAHLPQGAPTSPYLANLAAYRLDLRLAAAANFVGAEYTRYADDLVFSGDEAFARQASTFATRVAVIATDEGFVVNHRKTRLKGQGARQLVGGLVVNHHAQVARSDYDRVRALLRNCIDRGPQTQNRDGHADYAAHVRGLVAWAATGNPTRRARLEALYAQIHWSAP